MEAVFNLFSASLHICNGKKKIKNFNHPFYFTFQKLCKFANRLKNTQKTRSIGCKQRFWIAKCCANILQICKPFILLIIIFFIYKTFLYWIHERKSTNSNRFALEKMAGR